MYSYTYIYIYIKKCLWRTSACWTCWTCPSGRLREEPWTSTPSTSSSMRCSGTWTSRRWPPAGRTLLPATGTRRRRRQGRSSGPAPSPSSSGPSAPASGAARTAWLRWEPHSHLVLWNIRLKNTVYYKNKTRCYKLKLFFWPQIKYKSRCLVWFGTPKIVAFCSSHILI